MRVGFTGTRKGMTSAQRSAVEQWVLSHQKWSALAHGACVGADEDAAQIFYDDRGMFGPKPIFACPSTITGLTSKAALTLSDEVLPARPPLERNHNIVNMADVLLACPKGTGEERRSGTWATIRYARRLKRPVVIVWPNGELHGPPDLID